MDAAPYDVVAHTDVLADHDGLSVGDVLVDHVVVVDIHDASVDIRAYDCVDEWAVVDRSVHMDLMVVDDVQ